MVDDLAAIRNFLRAKLGHLADLVVGDVLRDFEFAVVLQVMTALLTEPVCSWKMIQGIAGCRCFSALRKRPRPCENSIATDHNNNIL